MEGDSDAKKRKCFGLGVVAQAEACPYAEGASEGLEGLGEDHLGAVPLADRPLVVPHDIARHGRELAQHLQVPA